MSSNTAEICLVVIPISAFVCVICFCQLLKGRSIDGYSAIGFGFTASLGLVCSIPFYNTPLKWIAFVFPFVFLGLVISVLGFILLHTVVQKNDVNKSSDEKE